MAPVATGTGLAPQGAPSETWADDATLRQAQETISVPSHLGTAESQARHGPAVASGRSAENLTAQDLCIRPHREPGSVQM